MEKLKDLVGLCKQRKQMFLEDEYGFNCIFSSHGFDEAYQNLTKKINRLANSLNVYHIDIDSNQTSIAFRSLPDLKKFTKDMELSKQATDYDDIQYCISLFNGDLRLYCFEKEEHKKAQAI